MSNTRTSPVGEAKRRIGELAATLVRPGMRVGLGTGSTATEMVNALGRRWREEGLRFEAVGTSAATEELARHHNIPVLAMDPARPLDLYMDGADEIDAHGHLIKGLGGALLREKLVAANALRHVIMVDASKPVRRLGEKTRVPVETVRFGWETTAARLQAHRCEPVLRMRGAQAYLTDESNLILDCRFPEGIGDAAALSRELKGILGVVETGLFVGYCHEVLIGTHEAAECIPLEAWRERIADFLR